MGAETAAVVDDFYDAWNRHDVPAIAGPFGASGLFDDPLTRRGLSGGELREHVQNVLDVVSDLRIAVNRTISDEHAAAAAWTIEGTWDGMLGRLTAAEAPVRFEGTDVFEFENGRLRRLRRLFDEIAVADALGLQTIVEPFSDGATTFGHSLRSWVSKEKPGALGMTWILARDEAEKLAIRAHARDIVAHFARCPVSSASSRALPASMDSR